MNITDLHYNNPYEDFDHTNYKLDVRGWNFEADIFANLVNEYSPSLIVEVGTWMGGSAFKMAEALRSLGSNGKIVCVDTWLGSLEFWEDHQDIDRYRALKLKHGYPSCYYQFLANVKHKGLQDYVIPFPQTSTIASKWFAQNNKRPNMIYIDGSHDYEDVYSDLKNWYPLLDFNSVIFGDDYNWPSVRQAVDQFCSEISLPSLALPPPCKWVIQKAGIKNFGVLISSHVKYSEPRNRLLKSLEASKISKDRIFLAIGGSAEEKLVKENGIMTAYTKHNSFDHTASIEFCRHSYALNYFPDHLLLLHDTMEVTPNTDAYVKRADPNRKATSASFDIGGGMCNLMLVQKKYLLSESSFLYSLINCSKQEACATEGVLFRVLPDSQKGHWASAKVDWQEPTPVYGGAPRRKEFYHGPQILKYKGNWGQPHQPWALKP